MPIGQTKNSNWSGSTPNNGARNMRSRCNAQLSSLELQAQIREAEPEPQFLARLKAAHYNVLDHDGDRGCKQVTTARPGQPHPFIINGKWSGLLSPGND
jgi:hypothetical protein